MIAERSGLRCAHVHLDAPHVGCLGCIGGLHEVEFRLEAAEARKKDVLVEALAPTPAGAYPGQTDGGGIVPEHAKRPDALLVSPCASCWRPRMGQPGRSARTYPHAVLLASLPLVLHARPLVLASLRPKTSE